MMKSYFLVLVLLANATIAGPKVAHSSEPYPAVRAVDTDAMTANVAGMPKYSIKGIDLAEDLEGSDDGEGSIHLAYEVGDDNGYLVTENRILTHSARSRFFFAYF